MRLTFIEGLMLRLCVIYQLRKIAQRGERNYPRELLRRLGIGLTEVEFGAHLKSSETSGWSALSNGERYAVTLTFACAFKNVIALSPEGLMKHEMHGAQ